MINNVLIEVLSSIAQQERETIHQRQAEGIAAARAKGKSLGRPQIKRPPNWEEVIDKWQAKKISATDAMRKTGLKKSTFYNFLKEEGNDKTK